MKRLASVVTWFAAASLLATAHPAVGAQLTGMGGYQFGGQIETSAGDLEINDGVGFAAEIEFPIKAKSGTSLMLMWGFQPTNLQLNTGNVKTDVGSITNHYWHAGILRNLRTDNPDLVPFTQVGLGATMLSPENGDSKTKFSFGFGAGVKYAVNPKVAIRLQGQLYATMLTSDVWAGVGTGGADLSIGGQALLQGAIMGGVTFSLGGRKDSEPAPPPASEPAPQPPAQQPPAQQPPMEQPPAQQPPTEQPPTTQPPATEPPATTPPATETAGTPPSS